MLTQKSSDGFLGHLEANQLTLSLDFSGFSLHQREYRQHQGSTSLKENLAAALLAMWMAYEGKEW